MIGDLSMKIKSRYKKMYLIDLIDINKIDKKIDQ